MAEYNSTEAKTIGPVPLDFEQLLMFTTRQEVLHESGKTGHVTLEREIKICHTRRENGLFKYQVFLHAAQYHLDRMAEPYSALKTRILDALDELVLWVDHTGTIVGIHNMPFAQYQWNKIRSYLMTQYQGEIFMQHINQMDLRMSSVAFLIPYLQLPSMYGLYFNGYWGSYTHGNNTRHTAIYGEELNNQSIEELAQLQLPDRNNNRLVRLEIEAVKPPESIGTYSGSYTYLDGIPELLNINIDLNTNINLSYSAKWFGLKTYCP